MKSKGQKSGKDVDSPYNARLFFVVVTWWLFTTKPDRGQAFLGSMPMITKYFGAN